MTTERDHWLAVTNDPNWQRNHINDPNIPLAETLAAITEAFPRNPRRILEIGCGYGRLTTEIAALYPHADITGIDINAEILPEDAGNTIYHCRDHLSLEDLPPQDAIYSVAVFQHLPKHQKRDYIFDAATQLNPGGVLRVQFIEGDRDNYLDHWETVDQMERWFVDAGLGVSAIDGGLAHPQWTWIMGIK